MIVCEDVHGYSKRQGFQYTVLASVGNEPSGSLYVGLILVLERTLALKLTYRVRQDSLLWTPLRKESLAVSVHFGEDLVGYNGER